MSQVGISGWNSAEKLEDVQKLCLAIVNAIENVNRF